MTDQVLTGADISKLTSLIHSYSHKWRCVGLALKFDPNELKVIEGSPSLFTSAPTSYLTELLCQWVQWPTVNHPTRPTLGALCAALRSAPVGLGRLAEDVEREMKCSTIGGKESFAMCAHYQTNPLPHPVCSTFWSLQWCMPINIFVVLVEVYLKVLNRAVIVDGTPSLVHRSPPPP